MNPTIPGHPNNTTLKTYRGLRAHGRDVIRAALNALRLEAADIAPAPGDSPSSEQQVLILSNSNRTATAEIALADLRTGGGK